MYRERRGHGFFFSPRDYLNDPAVLAMSTLARGVYSTLLFALWDQPEPGVGPVAEGALAALSRATQEEWAEVRDQVATAFGRNGNGAWVQKRMVAEHRRQDDYYERKRRAGKAGRAIQLVGTTRADPGHTPGASPDSPDSPASPAKKKGL